MVWSRRTISLRFPSSIKVDNVIDTSYYYTYRKRGSIDTRGTTEDLDCKEGGGHAGFKGINRGCTSKGTECLAQELVYYCSH